MTVFDPYITEDTVPGTSFAIQHNVDFSPDVINNNGLVAGTDINGNCLIWTGSSGAQPTSIPGMGQPKALSDAGQLVDYNANLWTSPATTSTCSLIQPGQVQAIASLLPAPYQTEILNISPIAISNTNSIDGSVRILFNAQYQPAATSGTASAGAASWPNNTFLLTLQSGSVPTILQQVSLPPGTTTNLAAATVNSNGILADIGTTLITSGTTVVTSGTAALLVGPMDVVADTNNNYQVDSTDQRLTYVRFGLWDNAFDTATPANVLNGNAESANFVGSDSRRFYLRVSDPSAIGNSTAVQTVKADWFTQKPDGTDDDHPATDTITLTETAAGSGIFASKALMLVSDEVDNGQPTNTGLPGGGNAAEGAADHRLRRAALGDNMCFAYTPAAAGSPKTTKTLPIFNPAGGPDGIKTMMVQIANLFGGTSFTPILSDSNIQAIEASVKARFAVAGIQVNLQYSDTTDRIAVDATTNVNLNQVDPDHVDASSDFGKLASIVKANYPAVDPHTIFLILIQQFAAELSGDGSTHQLQGRAFSDGYFLSNPPGSPTSSLLHCSFAASQGIGATSFTTVVPPHELGHQLTGQIALDLTNNNHYTGAQMNENLMKNDAEDPAPGAPNGSRRLWNDLSHAFLPAPPSSHPYQIDYMRQSPLLK